MHVIDARSLPAVRTHCAAPASRRSLALPFSLPRPRADAAPATTTTSSRLSFGIYPGGAAGGASGWAPDNVSKDLAAVKQLDSSGAPFIAHLYAEYYGPGSYTAAQEIGSEVQTFAKAGIEVELVLAYRPTDEVPATDVPGFVTWTKSALGSLGKYLTYVQVTNEANVSGSSSSNDGYYPGAENALIQGVEGAKSYIVSHGLAVKVGFNWSYIAGRRLGSVLVLPGIQTGGATFEKDVDWVGVDVYPGTWQSLPTTLSFAAGVSQVMTQAIASTRSTFMPLADAPGERSDSDHRDRLPDRPEPHLRHAADGDCSPRWRRWSARDTTYNVSALQFFDLRDAITDTTVVADQYGLMTDQWAPKPAFAAYERADHTVRRSNERLDRAREHDFSPAAVGHVFRLCFSNEWPVA